jgi:hypothetical protein
MIKVVDYTPAKVVGGSWGCYTINEIDIECRFLREIMQLERGSNSLKIARRGTTEKFIN